MQISNDLKQRKLGQEPTRGQDLIREVHEVGSYLVVILLNKS